DKIKISDIVFLRALHTIPIKKLYNPITSLLSVTYMRSIAEIRRSKNMAVPNKRDSHYKPIERVAKHFNPLQIPKSLQAELPFKSKPKIIKTDNTTSRAVVMDERDKKVSDLIGKINLLYKDKSKKKREKDTKQRTEYKLKRQAEEAEADSRRKKKRKTFFRKEGQHQRGSGSKD
ncbi:Glycoside hydrolase 2 (Mannanase, beta-galactosidase), partial [Coemansia sp. RSA 2681]